MSLQTKRLKGGHGGDLAWHGINYPAIGGNCASEMIHIDGRCASTLERPIVGTYWSTGTQIERSLDVNRNEGKWGGGGLSLRGNMGGKRNGMKWRGRRNGWMGWVTQRLKRVMRSHPFSHRLQLSRLLFLFLR